MHIYTHVCMHARTHTDTHAQTHTQTHARTHARTHAQTHMQTHARTHTHTHTGMHAHTHTHACTHTCTDFALFVYFYWGCYFNVVPLCGVLLTPGTTCHITCASLVCFRWRQRDNSRLRRALLDLTRKSRILVGLTPGAGSIHLFIY